MRTRRIAISACTLCLAIPATAGASPATNASQAEGPYGTSPTTRPQTSSAASIHGSPASPRGDTNGWRTAAISGAVLLAAVALAWALLLPARPRMVT
jgi:hypothetical protein